MKLFAGLRSIQEYQRGQLPFIRSLAEWDIIIEIGYAEECGDPITLKQLLLLNICSRNTMRRKLAQLTAQQIILSRRQVEDRRANLLVISPVTLRLLGRYGEMLKEIAGTHFKRGSQVIKN
jgi:hypothetical protein